MHFFLYPNPSPNLSTNSIQKYDYALHVVAKYYVRKKLGSDRVGWFVSAHIELQFVYFVAKRDDDEQSG